MLNAKERLQYFEEKQNLSKLKTTEQIESEKYQKTLEETAMDIYDMQYKTDQRKRNFGMFCESVKKDLLIECINIIFEKSCGIECADKADIIRRNLVSNFVNEEGSNNIIRRMKVESIPLAEMANTIEKYYNIIVKENKDLPEFSIDVETRNNFYDELNMDDVQDMSTTIKMRVAAELNEFIDSNNKEKMQIKDIVDSAKENIKEDQPEEVKESYEQMGKRWINNLKSLREKNILETMIHNIIESTIKKEDIRSTYMENGKLKMDDIVESATLLYTFLETLNTTKLHNVDESYIIKVLNSLK